MNITRLISGASKSFVFQRSAQVVGKQNLKNIALSTFGSNGHHIPMCMLATKNLKVQKQIAEYSLIETDENQKENHSKHEERTQRKIWICFGTLLTLTLASISV